ncbi:MAG: energy-coupling factor ABC transporter ATP-binding protein [Kiritimatiellia bacterium]
MKTALTFRDVSLRYRPEDPFILKGLSLIIAPGERVALLGLNGSGKTTLLYAAVGLIPFTGDISACDVPLSKATARQVRDNIGFLFGIPDDQILFPNVLDDIAFTLERRGASREEARETSLPILTRLGIAQLASLSPDRLSQGQKQRVALAGALLVNPPLLLLDEPSASLDPVGKEETAQMLVSMDAAMLIATHDVAFARRVCTRFLVLSHGGIAEDTADPERIEHYWCRRADTCCSGRPPDEQ